MGNISTDNRNYDYSKVKDDPRPDYDRIVELIPQNSKLVDLACGNGNLMQRLVSEKGADVTGVELSESGVKICNEKNFKVIHGRIDQVLPFKENEFEYAICHITIQMVMYPEVLLQEMKRISRYQIISFPNFAFYRNRFDLLLNGRMPRPMLFDYKWYSTGHIHQLSSNDFLELMNDVGGLSVEEYTYQKSGNAVKDYLIKKFPNLFQLLIVYLLKKI